MKLSTIFVQNIQRTVFSICLLLVVPSAYATLHTGTNEIGTYTDFNFTTTSDNSNLRLSVDAEAGVGSHILLKYGTALTDNTDFDYSSELDGADNQIYLSSGLTVGTWYVRIYTPVTASSSHAFTLVRDLDRAATPTIQTTDTFVINNDNLTTATGFSDRFYKIQVPTTPIDWRIEVTGSASTDVTLLEQYPTDGTQIASSIGQNSHILNISAASLTGGQTYFLHVHANENVSYSVTSAYEMNWDPGTAVAGTNVISQPGTNGGNYYFHITSQTAQSGAWRFALDVTSGEAAIYIQKNSMPSGNGSYRSENTGDDGYILAANQFNANEEWYIRVNATAGATWNLHSGDVYVHDLGVLAADTSSSSGNVTVGPEGMVYFKTSVPAGTKAWHLWDKGTGSNIYVRKNSVPVDTGSYSIKDKTTEGLSPASDQLLLVPTYLTNDLYFVGVSGTSGSTVNLDSRIQEIRTPSTQTGYVWNSPAIAGSEEFAFSLSGSDDTGYGYVTYQIEVPVDQIAWQVNSTSTSGNAEIYLRQGDVPNRWNNNGLSEAPSNVIDNISVVPPTLTNGTWYITVYGNGSFTYTLSSGNPVISGVDFINTSDADPVPTGYSYPYGVVPLGNVGYESQSGWRYYQVSDITSQLGFLGWELELANHVSGSEIAIRRNAVPARWRYRSNGNTYINSSSHVDYSSTNDILQRQGHPADIWYIGIYLPDQALGNFDLTSRGIPSPVSTFSDSSTPVVDQPADTWKFFKITVPTDSNLLGWDLRLVDVTGGSPQMVLRRDELPENFSTTSRACNTNSSSITTNECSAWASGDSWSAQYPWSNRNLSSTDENETIATL